MADFFSDLFGGLTGQQAAPQQTIIPTDQLIGQSYGMAQGLFPQLGAYNQGLVNATLPSQLQAEALYDPNAAALRSATSRSILDQLNLGGGLDQELQNQVITNALEGNAATGFGVGTGGRGLVARDLGLTSLDLLRRRQQDALGAVRSSPSLSSLFQPDRGFSPGTIAQGIQGEQAARDEFANLTEDIRRLNFASLINTGGRILGSVVGGVAGSFIGNPAGGAMAGGAIGGQLYQGSRVAGMQQPQSQQGGGFASILSGLFGGGGGAIGGPRYGIGSRTYYPGGGAEGVQSVQAAPVNMGAGF